VHHDVDDLISHLRSFDRLRQELEHSDDSRRRQRVRTQLQAEATEMARDLAHLSQEESILADALVSLLH
jgi:hypothetical protein